MVTLKRTFFAEYSVVDGYYFIPRSPSRGEDRPREDEKDGRREDGGAGESIFPFGEKKIYDVFGFEFFL